MLRRHPILAILHLLNGLKARPRPPCSWTVKLVVI
jgi:hypothetical protein